MPHTRSAKKNLRKTQKLRLHNRAVKKAVKTQIKRFQAALEGPVEELRTQFNLACKRLDKAAAKNIVHANLAAQEVAAGPRPARQGNRPQARRHLKTNKGERRGVSPPCSVVPFQTAG